MEKESMDDEGENFEAKLFAFEKISEIEDKVSFSICINRDNPLWEQMIEAFKEDKEIQIKIMELK
jgi:hypothetical protein